MYSGIDMLPEEGRYKDEIQNSSSHMRGYVALY